MKRAQSDIWFLGAISCVALLLRLDFLFASNFVIDSDEGIVGIMAKRMIEGHGVPVFFLGQPYMGSFESIVAAVLFYLFGISSVALKVTPLIFSILLIPLTYRLGEALGGRRCARVAAILMAVPPSAMVTWSAMARGGFVEIMCVITLALLLTVKWLKAPTILFTGVIAALLGFGWWTNNQVVYCMLPIGFVMLSHLWQKDDYPIGPIASHLVTGLGAFIIGGLPWWYYNLSNNWESLKIFGSAPKGHLTEHITGLFGTALPMLLGGKLLWHTEDLFPGASLLMLATYGIVLLFVLSWRAHALKGLLFFRIDEDNPVEIIFLFLLTAITAFALSSYGHLVTAPRYLLPIYPVVFILVGFVFERAYVLKKTLSFLILFFFLAINLYSSYPGRRALPGQPFVAFGERAASDHVDLITWLGNHQIEMVETNYWIGYRLAFETKEQVRFAMFQEPDQVRIPEYENEFNKIKIEKIPLILVQSQAAYVREALKEMGYTWKEESHSGYTIIFERTPPPEPVTKLNSQDMLVSASNHPEIASLAIDSNLDTRWGSGAPQSPGMFFLIELKEPQMIRDIQYQLGNWKTDGPRGLEITAELQNGETREILHNSGYQALNYYRAREPMIHLSGEPIKSIKLVQTGKDTFFDWTIAELNLYTAHD